MAESLTEYLDDKVATKFEARPYYCQDGDFLTYNITGEESYAQRVDELLTVYRSIETGDLVGCKINGIRHLLANLQNTSDS